MIGYWAMQQQQHRQPLWILHIHILMTKSIRLILNIKYSDGRIIKTLMALSIQSNQHWIAFQSI